MTAFRNNQKGMAMAVVLAMSSVLMIAFAGGAKLLSMQMSLGADKRDTVHRFWAVRGYQQAVVAVMGRKSMFEGEDGPGIRDVYVREARGAVARLNGIALNGTVSRDTERHLEIALQGPNRSTRTRVATFTEFAYSRAQEAAANYCTVAILNAGSKLHLHPGRYLDGNLCLNGSLQISSSTQARRLVGGLVYSATDSKLSRAEGTSTFFRPWSPGGVELLIEGTPAPRDFQKWLHLRLPNIRYMGRLSHHQGVDVAALQAAELLDGRSRGRRESRYSSVRQDNGSEGEERTQQGLAVSLEGDRFELYQWHSEKWGHLRTYSVQSVQNAFGGVIRSTEELWIKGRLDGRLTFVTDPGKDIVLAGDLVLENGNVNCEESAWAACSDDALALVSGRHLVLAPVERKSSIRERGYLHCQATLLAPNGTLHTFESSEWPADTKLGFYLQGSLLVDTLGALLFPDGNGYEEFVEWDRRYLSGRVQPPGLAPLAVRNAEGEGEDEGRLIRDGNWMPWRKETL